MKYYTRGKIVFTPCENSDIGLYVGDDLVLILPSLGDKYKIQFSNKSELITDMVTPINIFVDGNLVDKKSDKKFLVANHKVGDEVLYRLRARNDGVRSLTLKKSKHNKSKMFVDEFGNWYFPPNYNTVLGYIEF